MVDVQAPRAEDVDLISIARGLANACRYGRQLRHRGMFYSVAEHSVIVSQYVPPVYAREALLHDAGEAWPAFGDVPRPLKHTPRFHDAILSVEGLITAAVYARFGVTSTPASRRAIALVDDAVAVDEVAVVMARPDLFEFGEVRWLGATIACLAPAHAEHVFLQRFAELFPEYAAEAHAINDAAMREFVDRRVEEFFR
jgi:hypothetical protein